MADYPNARDCEHGRLRRSCEQCSDAFLIAALEARLAEVEQALRTARYWVDGAWRGADFGGFPHRAQRAKDDLDVIDAVLDKGEQR